MHTGRVARWVNIPSKFKLNVHMKSTGGCADAAPGGVGDGKNLYIPPQGSGSISSVETDTSTLNEAAWPGSLDVKRNAPISDLQRASESLRATIQALGPEKMAKIRSLTAVHQKNIGDSSSVARNPASDSACPLSTSSTAPADLPERPTDEVALTICHLESALGPEDMSELRAAMLLVRRQSVHLDVVISSDMSEEQLQQSVDTVRHRQDEVLELLFQEIMGLVATKLGVELDSDVQALVPVKAVEVTAKHVKRDESNMLKVPEVDLSGRRASTGTESSKKKRETLPRPKKQVDGYSRIFYGLRGPDKIIRVGDTQHTKGKGKATDSNEKAQGKQKKRRGCLGFCALM
ncbi:hypothetical protein BGX38DRAFT_1260859 [Terfezia claveryi]|nr:hypothetical protein BGX38DRAFT_1260859 [Terfezia claveryi]